MSTVVNPRSLGIEAKYVTYSVADLVALRRRLLAAGESEAVAAGIIGWLVAKAAGDPNSINATTKARYRRILERLDSDGHRHAVDAGENAESSDAGEVDGSGAPIIYELGGYVAPVLLAAA